MTSVTLPPQSHEAPRVTKRLMSIMRLHLVNKNQIIVTPWLIMSFIFAVSLLIGWMFRSANEPAASSDSGSFVQFNGALFYFYIYMLVLAVMAISQTFPFAQSYSVTRRNFYFGTVLTFFGLSVAFSVVLTALGWIEDMTHGWGLNVSMFNPGFYGPNLVERFYVSVVLFFFFFMIGIATASVYVRWKANGMYIFFGLLALTIIGLIWLVTATDSWGAVGNWIATTGLLGIVAWSLVPSSIALIVGFLILRKATPRN